MFQKLYALWGGAHQKTFDEQKVAEPLRSQLLTARRTGMLKLNYVVNDRLQAKQVSFIKAALDKAELEQAVSKLRANARNLHTLLTYLSQHPQAMQQGLLEKKLALSPETFRNAEKKGWITRFKQVQYRNPVRQLNVKRTVPRHLTPPAQAAALLQLLRKLTNSNQLLFYLKASLEAAKQKFTCRSLRMRLPKRKQP